ncbi:MAG: rRNA maturation RNase YbeY [Chloroflexi bacterium]|nr:rRNA maturation RNase YbeY [Chloroflexota bacterium]
MSYDISVAVDGAGRTVAIAPIEAFVEQVLVAEGVEDAAVALLLADDELLWRLNREHRDRDEPTDVLAFPAAEGDVFPSGDDEELPYLGDIAVSVGSVRRQAAEAGLGFEDELRHVILHAVLHLLGYDHEVPADALAMGAREESLLGPGIHEASSHVDD